MAIDIRFPQITETSVEGQLRQLKSCLIQYSDKLNWALNTLEKNTNDVVVKYESQSSSKASQELSPEKAESTFSALKGYIIKSADIVNAYSEEITKKLEGIYTAEASFPDGSAAAYIQKTSNEIKATNDSITQNYTVFQELITDLDARVKNITSDGYIKSGVLRYITEGDIEGAPLIGIEVGQTVSMDGTDVFNKFSRMTAGGLEFYDRDTKVAEITGYKMYITEAHVQTLCLREYQLDTSDGIMFLWEGDLEDGALSIIVSGEATSNYADITLFINDEFKKSYSGAHDVDTSSYVSVESAYIELSANSTGEVYVSADGNDWIMAFSGTDQVGSTFDLMALESDTIYIKHTYLS